MNNIKVFIFGAGASCENGVPLVRDVIETAINDIEVKFSQNESSFGTYEEEKADKYYTPVFKLIDDIHGTNSLEVYRKLVKKEGLMINFAYDIKNADKFRFEEFLSKIDECIENNKNLESYNPKLLKELRPYIHYLIFNTLSREAAMESGALDIYKQFIKNRLKNEGFYHLISLNYDTLLDSALSDIYFFDSTNRNSYMPWSYGVNFDYIDSNFISYNKEEKDLKIYLLKPHGSFNWMYCNKCSKIALYYSLAYENCNYFNKKTCHLCSSNDCELILVPPTYFKGKSKFSILKSVCAKAEEALRKADEITIIGYSLPQEDLDITSLLKNNIGVNKKPNITVVNESVTDINKIEEFLRGKNNYFEKVEGKFSEYVVKGLRPQHLTK